MSQNNKRDTDPSVPPQKDRCPECDGNIKRNDNKNELYCEDCYKVFSIDTCPKPKNTQRTGDEFGRSEQRESGSEVMYDGGLGSNVGNSTHSSDRDGSHTKNLKKTHHRTRYTDKDRTLIPGIQETRRLIAQLNLDHSVKQTAIKLLSQASDDGLFQRYRVEAFAAATVYTAAYVQRTPRLFPEVEEQTDIERSKIRNASSYVATMYVDIDLLGGDGIVQVPDDFWGKTEPNPFDLVQRIVVKIFEQTEDDDRDISEEQLTREAGSRLEEAISSGPTSLSNKSAKVLAATAVYLEASDMIDITQSDIADIAGTCSSSISQTAQQFQPSTGCAESHS